MDAWRSALKDALGTLLIPFRAATSKTAQRAYLGTALFTIAAIGLLGTSTVAFFLFYNLYVPQIGLQRKVYLQFGDGYPYGFAQLSSKLASSQPYDVSVLLHLPRTPANLATGNFMIDLTLLAPSSQKVSTANIIPSTFSASNGSASVLGQSRRPAIMTYTSTLVDQAHKLSNLPFYIFGWKKESEELEVSMFEGVQFAKGWRNIPDEVRVVVEADEKMQFYDVMVKITARFQALRYFLYNYRLTSFVIFSIAFFGVSMTASIVVYFIFSFWLASPDNGKSKREPSIKREGQDPEAKPFNPLSVSDLSDTARTFPSRGRQGPLYFQSRDEAQKIKQGDIYYDNAAGIPPLEAEADDEDEDEGYAGSSTFKDSGIGTGIDDDKRGTPRRRKSSREP